MQYRVKWFVGEREVGSTPFSSLSTAKSHAMEHFPAKQMQSGVDRVEVRDEDGKLVFHQPRTLSRH